MKELFLFAGETSGDLYGSALMRELPDNIRVSGVGGPLMRKEGLDQFLPMEDFQVHGIGQILSDFPKIVRQFYRIRDQILKKNPDGVVFIDYPGLNIRMANALRKKGYDGRLIHYISPTVWAWGQNRVFQMEKALDLLLTIFPFEAKYYAETSLPVRFVGHPMISRIENHQYDENWLLLARIFPEISSQSGQDVAPYLLRNPREHCPRDKASEFLGEDGVTDCPNCPRVHEICGQGDELLALLPGSRTSEIKRNLPRMLQAAKEWKKGAVAVSLAQETQRELIEKIIQESGCPAIIVPPEHRYELMRDSKLAIASLGTVHLELALHETPTIGVYDLSFLNRFYARFILRLDLPFYSIVNIISGRELFPEFVKIPATSSDLVQAMNSLDLEKCREGCRELKKMFGQEDASKRAAASITEILL